MYDGWLDTKSRIWTPKSKLRCPKSGLGLRAQHNKHRSESGLYSKKDGLLVHHGTMVIYLIYQRASLLTLLAFVVDPGTLSVAPIMSHIVPIRVAGAL